MASGPLIAPLPWTELKPGCRIVLEAIDAATGATVAGVRVRDITIYARETDDGGADDPSTLEVWLQPASSVS